MSIQMQAKKPMRHLGIAVGDVYEVATEQEAKRHEYAGRGTRYTPPKTAGKAPSKTKPAGPSKAKPAAPSFTKRQKSPGWFDVVDASGHVINEKSLRSDDADAFIAELRDA